MSDTWSIGELAEHAAHELRAGAQPVNGRVRDVPGERLIRWYTTIGLVDPPLTRRGRIAQYGRRHLLQLVAIKRMQAAGHSIAQIQSALTGATDTMLESAAELDSVPSGEAAPVNGPAARSDHDGVGRSGDGSKGGGSRRDRFWAERPSDRGDTTAADIGARPGSVDPGARAGSDDSAGRTGSGGSGSRTGSGESARRAAGQVIAGVRLGDGVRLVLDAGRVPSEEDVQAVLAAAGPLLAVLEERRLL
jgi:DNA-binding transcriptional MerR regulator